MEAGLRVALIDGDELGAETEPDYGDIDAPARHGKASEAARLLRRKATPFRASSSPLASSGRHSDTALAISPTEGVKLSITIWPP
jgi:hypothetical protein